MAQKRFYGVKNHPEEEKNGVYDSWEVCSGVVRGAKGVSYKGFGTREEAEAFCGIGVEKTAEPVASPVQQQSAVRTETPHAPAGSGLVFDARKAMSALDYLKGCNVMDNSTYSSIKLNIGQKSLESAKEKEIGIDPTRMSLDQIVMFVDGSYNDRNDRAGFGVYIQGIGEDTRGKGKESVLCGSVPMVSGGRNVEGEVTAAWMGLDYLASKGALTGPVTVYYDYEGVGKWADGSWRANKDYTKAYAEKVDALRQNGADIRFVHVDGHTGVEGNEMVDRLAKMGCGIRFPKENEFRQDLARVPGMGSMTILDIPVHQKDFTMTEPQNDGMEF